MLKVLEPEEDWEWNNLNDHDGPKFPVQEYCGHVMLLQHIHAS